MNKKELKGISETLQCFYLNCSSFQQSLVKNIIISLSCYFNMIDKKFNSDKFKEDCGMINKK